MIYPIKTFVLPVLEGFSEKQIAVHLALYEGYVKNVNLILENPDAGRFAFEFNGMRMHEYYFEQFQLLEVGIPDGASGLQEDTIKDIEEHVREVASTRGVGWAVVYFDPTVKTLHTIFVNDHEIGQLTGLPILLALDLWEHAYMVDYVPAEKKDYIDAFFSNLNWNIVERRLEAAM